MSRTPNSMNEASAGVSERHSGPGEASRREGEVPEADEVYRITAHWRPSAHTDLDDPVTETVTGWAAARRKALKLTCLAGTIAVVVRDADGDLVAHWDGYSNRWHERNMGAEPAVEAPDEWARTGKLWAELRQWLRYRDDWTVQIDPWGIYGCVTVTATHRSGSPERKYSEHGENLEVRLINVLAWLKGQPE